jgi:Leucine-rich repeat (LRR) protein
LQELDLASSSDLVCTNIICEKVGDPCICRLSHALERLTGLVSLRLSGNRLTALPASIGGLENLEHLDASNNDITELPCTLGDLRCLKTLNVSGNPVAVNLPDLGLQAQIAK